MASSSPEITSSAVSSDTQPRFSYKDASHEEVLEDLSSRFILNLPDEELASLERICFQVEQAHWFYEDFIREQNPTFPSLPLKKFSAMLFHACPLLHQWSNDHENAFNMFMQYKTRVPVCGAIMLNDTWDKCVLVKGWKSSSGWGFPKGKINEDEPKHICAIREVLEETGYNLAGKLKPEHVIELSIKEQRISLFVVPGVEEDFAFQTKTRKEISRIEWFRLADLPTWKRNKQVPGKFYLISPFIGPLKAFVNEHKPRPGRKAGRRGKNQKISSNGNSYTSDHVATDADTDVVHESDSQTSDTQAANPGATFGGQTTSKSGVDMLKSDNMDPHFARLLNSLTLSASGTIHQMSNDLQPPQSDPSTPTPNVLSRDIGSATLSDKPRNLQLSPWPHKSPSSISTHDFVRDSSCTPVAGNHQLPYSHPVQVREFRSPTHSVQVPSTEASIQSTSPNARRAIRTDISPYLAKASGEDTSARRLQHLALLERVADESAKMLPQARPNAVGLSPSLTPAHPGSAIPVPVPGPGDLIPPRDVFYSSSPPQNMNMINPMTSFSRPHNGGPLDRSRTSQAFHRSVPPSTGSLSMNQSQLLALMNNSHPPPPPPRYPPLIQRPASNFTPVQAFTHAPVYNPSVNLPAFPQTQAPHLYSKNPPNFPVHGNAVPPNRFASATPAVDSFPTRAAPDPRTAQTLLSILNGNRPLQSNQPT